MKLLLPQMYVVEQSWLSVSLSNSILKKSHCHFWSMPPFIHVNSVVQPSFQKYFQDKIISIKQKHLESVIYAFITSQLDYCNTFSVLYPKTLTTRHDHITPILVSLHWLPYWLLTKPREALLTHLLLPFAPSLALRSSVTSFHVVPSSRLCTYHLRRSGLQTQLHK